MADWGDGVPDYSDFPAGAWGYGLPLCPVEEITAQNFIAEILIGDVVVWSAVNDFPQDTITIDVSSVYGKQELKFRIRGTD